MRSTYHNEDAAEDDHFEEGDVYVALGKDPVQKMQAELSKRVDEARSNGISEDGAESLTELLNDYQEVFE